MLDSHHCLAILDGFTTPNVQRGYLPHGIPSPQLIPHQGTPLCDNLEDMPICLLDNPEHSINNFPRDILVEKITGTRSRIFGAGIWHRRG